MATKPQLRGLGKKAWTYCLYSSLFASASFALWYKKYVLEARKKHYIEFYETYDDEKEFNAMKAANLFKGFEPS